MGDIRKAIKKIVPKQNGTKWGEPLSSYKITFDSQQAQLEPIYYWLLDFIQDAGWDVKKLTDNFMSSPGSGHFSEMGQKQTRMQEEGMKMLGSLNTVIKSSLNLIYDLKEFEIRLEHYADYRSENKDRRYKGMLALKQIWMDNVDIKKGNGSINVLSSQAGFVTLRDLFFTIDNEDQLKKISNDKDGIVNSQTQRILTPRLSEFWKWVDYSEAELTKRMNIEKNYLKSQIETIKLYSSWIRPYLKAAQDLRQQGFENNAALVNAFSTSLFELELFAKGKSPGAPGKFKDYNLKRNYYPIIIVNMKYRGHVSQRATQQGDQYFARGGRVDMTFDCYVLNEEELKLVEKEMEKDDFANALEFSGDMAMDAIDQMKEDLEHFLGKPEERLKKEEKKKKDNDINPFAVLFRPIKNIFKNKEEKKREKGEIEIQEITDIKKDNYVERAVRAEAADSAVNFLYAVYDVYKKSHGMPSPPGDGFVNWQDAAVSEPDVEVSDIFSGQDGSAKHKEEN